MPDHVFDRESEAFEALNELIGHARTTREAFVRAGLALPAPLVRFFGESGDEERASQSPGVTVPPLREPPRPKEASDGWIYVPIDEALTITLVRAILRKRGEASRPKDVADEIIQRRPTLVAGGVYNTGPRLEKAGVIRKTPEGWALADFGSGPIVDDENVWAHPRDLQKSEVAWHRRMIIVHLLSVYKSGLQVLQIVEQLQAFSQCKAPVSKDLVKTDMQVLADQKRVRRAGNSKKWVLAQGGIE